MKVAITIASLFMIFTPTITALTQRESNIKSMSINPRGRLEYPVYYCKRDFFNDGFERSSASSRATWSEEEFAVHSTTTGTARALCSRLLQCVRRLFRIGSEEEFPASDLRVLVTGCKYLRFKAGDVAYMDRSEFWAHALQHFQTSWNLVPVYC
ncbi:hypothetical protein FPQ18DRAFT_311006 [Pyronema domesticum]|nr:hypothetical protein FPQ18DRAFT_311006 [Pyronema domesticum]